MRADTSGLPFRTLDTVADERPLSSASCAIVTRPLPTELRCVVVPSLRADPAGALSRPSFMKNRLASFWIIPITFESDSSVSRTDAAPTRRTLAVRRGP